MLRPEAVWPEAVHLSVYSSMNGKRESDETAIWPEQEPLAEMKK